MQLLTKIPGVESASIRGTPIVVNDFSVTPIVRRLRWRWASQGTHSGGTLLQLRPIAVRVTTDNGTEQQIPICNPMTKSLFALGTAAVVLAVGCASVMAVVVRFSRRRTGMEKKDATGNATGHHTD